MGNLEITPYSREISAAQILHLSTFFSRNVFFYSLDNNSPLALTRYQKTNQDLIYLNYQWESYLYEKIYCKKKKMVDNFQPSFQWSGWNNFLLKYLINRTSVICLKNCVHLQLLKTKIVLQKLSWKSSKIWEEDRGLNLWFFLECLY